MIRIFILFILSLGFLSSQAQIGEKGPAGDQAPQNSINNTDIKFNDSYKGKPRTARSLNPSGTTISFKNFGKLHGLTQMPQDGIYTWANGRIIAINKLSEKATYRSSEDLGAAAKAYILEHREAMFLGSDTDFIVTEQNEDKLGMSHVKLQQTYNGIKVYGAESWVHGKDGHMSSYNGRAFPMDEEFNPIPAVDETLATAVVTSDLGQSVTLDNKSMELLNREQIIAELVILIEHEFSQERKLVWHIDIFPNLHDHFHYFIDSQTGNIVGSYKDVCYFIPDVSHRKTHSIECPIDKESTDSENTVLLDGATTSTGLDLNNVSQTINVYQAGSNFYTVDAARTMYNASASNMPNSPVGTIVTLDAFNTDPQSYNFDYELISSGSNSFPKKAISAHFNAGKAYEYYKQTHNRESIDGQGGNILSLIKVGQNLENAFWNGQAMFYGDGGNDFKPLAGALDVAGHELSHGVIQKTANLEYLGEAGALNESFADVFGAMIDRDDWKMGEDVVKPAAFPSGALRDLSNPHNGGNSLNDPGWQPDHMSEKYTGSQDNGGVHINSGIINHAFYLFASNGSVGKAKAEKVFYRALTQYLVKSSQFIDMRIAVVNASDDLYDEAVINAAKNAFSEVGIGEGAGSNHQDDINTNPGDNYLLFTGPDYSDIKLADAEGTILADPFINIGVYSRPSVTDDGTLMVFVDGEKKLRYVELDWSNTSNPITEVGYLSESSVWRNIIVSRDGSTVAALEDNTDTDESNNLTIASFVLGEQVTIELFNPTTADPNGGAINTADFEYADAMEFDFTGEWVVYDGFNSLEGQNFEDIDYWDVSFVKVWDNQTNNFPIEVQITKLFTSLPEGVSIGNPTFAKNSPYIMGFDYVVSDQFNTIFHLAVSNIETGGIYSLYENEVINYPCYSIQDDLLTFDATYDNTGDEVLGGVPLEADKISASGNAFGFIDEARWGVWFATGERDLVDNEDVEVLPLSLFPNPVDKAFQLSVPSSGEYLIEAVSIDGKKLWKEKRQITQQTTINTDSWPSGSYFISVKGKDKNLRSQLTVIH